MRGLAALAAILSFAAVPAAAAELTAAVHLCGTLVAHQPATATASGTLRIGTRTYVVRAATVAGNGGVDVALGKDLCVEGSVAARAGELVRYTFFWLPPDARYCGTVLSAGAEADTIASEWGQLRLLREAGLPPVAQYDRVCYRGAIRRETGDLAAVSRLPLEGPGAFQPVARCGTIGAYRPATASADGLIKVGSLDYTIVRGTAYTGDPAGDRTDRTAVGQRMCLRGTLAPSPDPAIRRLTEYLTSPMPTQQGGTAKDFYPQGDGRGLAILSYATTLPLLIPEHIDKAVDVTRAHHCFEVGVDAAGDQIATAVIPCEPGSATAATAAPSPPPTAAPLPTAAPASAPPTPLAATAPTLAPQLAPSSPAGTDAEVPRFLGVPALAVMSAAAALAMLAAWLRQRMS